MILIWKYGTYLSNQMEYKKEHAPMITLLTGTLITLFKRASQRLIRIYHSYLESNLRSTLARGTGGNPNLDESF